MLLEGPDRLHKRPLKIRADAHNLSRRLHLGRKRSLGIDKFIKRKPWNFHDTVVERGLKAGKSLAGHRVWDLIQRIAEGDLRRHLGNRIPGRL